MITNDEILIKLRELTNSDFTISDKILNSINGKIKYHYDNEIKELLHLKNLSNINPLTDKKNRIFKPVYQGIIPDKIETINIKHKEKISAFFTTHGTIFDYKNPKDKYFWDYKLKFCGNNYANDIARFLNCKYGFYLKWLGNNNHNCRKKAAEKLFLNILGNLYEISKNENIAPEQIPITLSGHSHGGNIMILIADKLISSGFKVKQIITLNTPVRPEYKLKNRIQHINLFSFLDWVQIAGGWDFDVHGWTSVGGRKDAKEPTDNCICDEDFRGPAKRMFNSAINICIDSKINMDDRLNFIRTQRNLSVPIFLQHNITMWSKFVIKCLGD
ncbi:MAG: hypothetical protein KA885_01445 [Spirochaetes bacterium]|nr:hypothetical protein [Spirochaetota bacterium]